MWPWSYWMDWKESDLEFFDKYFPYAFFFIVIGYIFGIAFIYNEYNEENKGH